MNTEQAKALFTKYLNNECSKEERELLETFLDSYQGKDFLKEETQIDALNDSKDRVWSNILAQVEEQPKAKKQFPFGSNIIYAIAASLVLFLAITIFYQNDKTNPISNTVAEQPIEIGTDKATLTLENGSTIALEKGKIYNNTNVDSNGENLVYHSDENDLKEIVFNYLTIPRGGQFYVELSDGTKVWLNSESKLKYPVTFKEGQPRIVELVYGEAYFEVSPSTKHQGANFSVNSKGQTIEVLGTEFNVKAYQDEFNTYTTLVEGAIALDTNNERALLKPNQQAVVGQDDKVISIKTLEVYNEISWKEGVFSFKGKTLKELMKVVSRWYNVDVVFENKALETVSFKGVLGKDQSIEDILSAITSASAIKSYEIKNKTIYLK